MARGYRWNPAASLRVEQQYGAPVLLSGVAPLVLKKSETKKMNSYYKMHVEKLQRLFLSTPESVVHFLSGSLPLTGYTARYDFPTWS